MKILVVHRQKEVIVQIESVLQNNESNIRFSDSGLDGLLAARIENFDLIICSTDLPVITGFEMIRSLRTNSINSNTPVIFIATRIDDRTKHLSNSLQALALITVDDLNAKLIQVLKASDQIVSKDLLSLLSSQMN